MSKRADQLRAAGIYNDWHIVRKGRPWISLRRHEPRICQFSGWMVHVKGQDLPGPWYDHGSKSFTYSGVKRRAEALELAKAWVAEHYPDVVLVHSPFDRFDLVPQDDLERALAEAQKEPTP